MGDALAPLGALPTFGMVYVLTLLISLITEMVSNTATVTIVIPIMFELVSWEDLTVHPFPPLPNMMINRGFFTLF